MSKLAGLEQKAPGAAIKTLGDQPDSTTHHGGAGFSRDPKSELFLLAVTNMVGEDTFYEAASERDRRFIDLIHAVAVEDPDWLARFVPYLRNTMNMRSASVVLAAETVHAKLTRPVPASGVRNRDIISSALMRADEPAEMLGYWFHRYGRKVPMPVKRGVADAVQRLYTERSAIKYDGQGQKIRFADVIDIVHPEPKARWQSSLFHYLLDDRHDHLQPFGEGDTYPSMVKVGAEPGSIALPTLAAYRTAMALDQDTFRSLFSAELVSSAALTWETASSKYGTLDARFWEAMIPSMGIFAMVRNLRNIRDAKVGEPYLGIVRGRLTDRDEIAKSRMFPLRFYAAYRETADDFTWGRELEQALEWSVSNVPYLKGETIVLVDVSGSMAQAVGGKHAKMARAEAAGIFGAAVAVRAEKAHLIPFDTDLREEIKTGGAVLPTMRRITGIVGGNTNITGSIAEAYTKYPKADRIIVLTDEQQGGTTPSFGYGGFVSMFNASILQARGLAGDLSKIRIPIYTFNLAGYRTGALPSGGDKRYTFGGLTDAGFSMIEQLEAGHDAGWPF